MKNTLLLVDGNSLINRAYFAMSNNLDNGAVYGFMNMLLRALADTKATHLAVAFDVRAKTFRHKMYDGYKAHRKGMPDDLAEQLADLHKLLTVMNVKILEKEGFEADDIIGTIARQSSESEKCLTVISTADRDCLQLVNDCVELHLTKTGVTNTDIWTRERIEDTYGIKPRQLIDLKAIMGDKSDNIPGCFGVGEKTALDLIQKFGNLETIYDNLDELKPTLAEKMQNCRDAVLMSLKLAEIETAVPVEYNFDSLAFSFPLSAEVYEAFKERSFTSLCNRTNLWGKNKPSDVTNKPQQGTLEPQQIAFGFMPAPKVTEKAPPEPVTKTDDIKTKIIKSVGNPDAKELICEIEIPLVKILDKMHENGAKIDLNALDEVSQKFTAELDELTSKVHELAGKTFNLNSPQQLAAVLYEKTGQSFSSTDESVLRKISKSSPLAALILRYRKVYKLYSTYIQSYKNLADANGFLHSTFCNYSTSTGRITSVEPNLQNIPARNDEAKNVRSLFISRFPNGKIVTADYSQIELRLLAHFSGDEIMRTAFQTDRDIHAETAAKIFSVDRSNVTPDMRRSAKTVNFGIIYGMGAFALAETLHCPVGEATAFIDKYFAQFPKVKQYLDSVRDFAIANGYVETIMKRRRYLPELASRNQNTVKFGARAAINMPMQGSAADIIKKAMIAIDRELTNKNLRSVMIAQIHDELVFDCPETESDIVAALVKNLMESAVKISVPLEVETETADTL